MAIDKLHIDTLKKHFKNKPVFGTEDITRIYKQKDKGIESSSINWRIYSLVQKGVLQRIGRGEFAFGEGKNYVPDVLPKLKAVYSKVKAEFPYIGLCAFNTSSVNEFMQHQPGQFYYLVEVDKEAAESVFYFLREEKLSVFLDPTKDILGKYAPVGKDIIVVKPLVSEAPTQIVKNIQTSTIEKILVDIFCDDVIYAAQQGAEMRTVFNEAFGKYTVNQSKMLRYADRRGKKENFREFIRTISNLRQ